MKKILITLAAVLCCATATMAEMTQEQAMKEAEQKVAEADKHPENGKMSLEAALALYSDDMGDKKDLDRALTYAARALKIAQEHPAPQDTLKGLSSFAIGMIYLQKQSYENAFDYMDLAMDGFQEELGRYDPVTIGTKLIYGLFMMGKYPTRAYLRAAEAFMDNGLAPKNKRIENIELANIALEMALERHLVEQTQRFRYALPMFYKDGKRYLLVQTPYWNMERPLVGWQAARELATEEEKDQLTDEVIICDNDGNFSVLAEDDKDERMMYFNFKHKMRNPRFLEYEDNDARIFFLNPKAHDELLAKFREFKASLKK
jgi:exonuclease VII small subunit